MYRITAAIVVLAAVIGTSLLGYRTFLWSQAVTGNQAEQLRLLGSLAASASPAPGSAPNMVEDYLAGQEWDAQKIEIGGFQVNAYPFYIEPDVSRAVEYGGVMPKESWHPDVSKPLDEALPFPWPQKVIDRWGQRFHPNAMFHNARQLCGYFEKTQDGNAVVIAQRMYDRFLDYVIEIDGALYVLYRYEREYRDVPVANPWTTAYGSGAALIALTVLDTCLDIEGAKEHADKVVLGLAHPIDPEEERPRHWVSFVDEDGYLWFEEMPLDQEEQPRILNGHIRALTGLYAYWVKYKDETAAKLLQAGLTTIAHYAPNYRIPGKINRYDLIDPPIDDYGPERTISQQDLLFRMTGHPIFAIYRDVFESDMRDEIEAANADG